MSEQEPKIESFNNIPIGITRQDSLPDSDKNKENNDQISYDKNYWNLGEIPFPDLSLKKESESKLSIDVPDMSNQRLKEYLNEDLLDAIDVSPMTTPKNIMNFDNNEINLDNKDLFQFSLYNNNNDEKDNIAENEENNEDKDKDKDENKNENEINKIKEDEGGGNINILNNKNIENNIYSDNIIHNIANENNNNKEDFINNENININNENININNNNIIENINKEETNINKELDMNKEKNDNNIINNNNKTEDNKINIIEKDKNLNTIVQEIQKENENLEKKEIKENKDNKDNKEKNSTIPKKNYYQPQYQYQYPFIQFPYVTQPLMGSMNSFGYENKFDTNKKYQVLVPFTVLKKNVKVKKPFEIREGDWTCSNCNNLNFSFRVKCNRCFISKEQSEQDKNKENKENKENKIKKEEKEHKYPLNKNKTYYQNNSTNNNNTMQYKYYPGFIYVPIQAQFPKKEKK